MVQVVLVGLYIAVGVVLYLLFSKKSPKGLPPLAGGGYPIIGHTLSLVKDPTSFFLHNHMKYQGIYSIRLLWRDIVVISSRSYFNDYYKARETDLSFHEPLKETYINEAMWGTNDPPLSNFNILLIKKIVGERYEHIIREQAKLTLDELPNNGEIDLYQYSRRTVARIVSVLLLGFDCGEEVWGEMAKFETLVINVVRNGLVLGRTLSALRSKNTIEKKRNAIIDALVPLIRKARENPTNVYMKTINAHRKEDGEPLADEEVALMINGVFFAALTNTSNGVANMLYLAAAFPDELKKLVAEPMDSPIWNAWCMETARISSGFMGSRRDVVKEDYEIAGYHLPAGTMIMLDIKSSSLTNKEYDGPIAKETQFAPSRFLLPQAEETKKFGVLNWGAGVHICPGKIFAMAEMKGVLAVVAENLSLSQPNTELGIKYVTNNAMKLLVDNFKVQFHKVKI